MPAVRTGRMPVFRKGENRMRFLIFMIPELYQPKSGHKTIRISCRRPKAVPTSSGALRQRNSAEWWPRV